MSDASLPTNGFYFKMCINATLYYIFHNYLIIYVNINIEGKVKVKQKPDMHDFLVTLITIKYSDLILKDAGNDI